MSKIYKICEYFNKTFRIKTIRNFSDLACLQNIQRPNSRINLRVSTVQRCYDFSTCFATRTIVCLTQGTEGHLFVTDVSVLRTFYFLRRGETSGRLRGTLGDPILPRLLDRKICVQGGGIKSNAFYLPVVFLLILHASRGEVLGTFDEWHEGLLDHLH